MSRSSFQTTKETDLCSHPMNRSNENTLTTKTTNTSINRHNPKTKRNLRDKRRGTGIRPHEIPLTSAPTEASTNDDNINEDNANEQEQDDQTFTSTKSMLNVNGIQSTFDNLSIDCSTSAMKHIRPDEFRLRQVEKQTSDDDLSRLKECIHTLETIVHEKDNYIHDLQQKLTNLTQNLTEAEEEIYKLHQDKLTLIKAFSTTQDNKSSSLRSNLLPRN